MLWLWVSLHFEKVSDFVVHGREFRGRIGDDFLNNMEEEEQDKRNKGEN